MTKQITGKVVAVDWIAENGYPEVGTFTDAKDLKKFYKQLDMAVIKDWIELEGLEYKECLDSEPIDRMRACMAILYKHFPKPEGKKKSESKYKKFTTDELVQMAIDNEVAFEVTENEQILRMRAIMALRAAKVIE